MRLRKFTILILTLLLTFPAATAQDISDDDNAEENLTQEEKREAREIAQKVFERFNVKKDYGKLTGEFFVSDFRERLHAEQIRKPYFERDDETPFIAPADAYCSWFIEITNFYSMAIQLYQLKEEDENKSSNSTEIFSPDLIAEIKSNSVLRSFFLSADIIDRDEIIDDEADVDSNDNDSDFEIKDEATLRELNTNLKKFNERLGEYVKEVQQSKPDKKDAKTETEDNDYFDFNLLIIGIDEESSFFGLPDGTRLVCVTIHSLVLHFDLVRIDGRLQIIDISPATSD